MLEPISTTKMYKTKIGRGEKRENEQEQRQTSEGAGYPRVMQGGMKRPGRGIVRKYTTNQEAEGQIKK